MEQKQTQSCGFRTPVIRWGFPIPSEHSRMILFRWLDLKNQSDRRLILLENLYQSFDLVIVGRIKATLPFKDTLCWGGGVHLSCVVVAKEKSSLYFLEDMHILLYFLLHLVLSLFLCVIYLSNL